MTEVIYYGCIDGGKHELHSKFNSRISLNDVPWGQGVGTSLVPSADSKVEGELYWEKHGGWSAVCFWDRSGDQRSERGGAVSIFMAQADMTMNELVLTAYDQWPEIFLRPHFPRLVYPTFSSAVPS